MNDPDFARRLRETFQAEASEHLRALSRDAFELENTTEASQQAPIVERMFRETHTLKGAARMVAEHEAESLCHALEQQMSGLKHAGAGVPAGLVAELHQQIAEISRVLGLHVAAPQPEAPAVVVTETPSVVTTGQIRVPAARLDALLARAEEMAGAKLSAERSVTALHELRERSVAWKREWDRVRSDVAAVRRFVDTSAQSPIAKELRALVHYIEWNHESLRGWQTELAQLARSAAADQRRLGTMVDQLLDETKETLMQPFGSLLEIFPAFVRDIAAQQGKEIELTMAGADTEIDRRVLDELRDALMHLVRNAIDHAIEVPGERRAGGKTARGRLTIAVQQRGGGDVAISVSDDGRGIDPAEVTENARRLGHLAPDAPPLSPEAALSLVFTSGFSTRATATELSGRGLGLSIVREKAEQIGGAVNVESMVGRGTTFSIIVPVTLARFRGVFVPAQGQTFVVPSSYVRRVLRRPETEIKRVKNQELVEVDGTSVVLLRLSEVLGMATAGGTKGGENAAVFILLLESGRSRVALRVDGVPHEQELVMKNLGRMLRRVRHYVGATIVGDGQVVPVLNVNTLLGAAVRHAGAARAVAAAPATPAARRKRSILVAEDSITSRSLLKNILQAAGFEVRTAVDGADALTTLKFEPIDLVISDVQMPRIDGFELTAKIRADQALSTLPVILITSLASREDKARGVDAGANAYIVKSSFDQSNLLEAIARLIP